MDFNREMTTVLAKIPLIIKILIGGVPLLIVIVWFITMQIDGINYKRQFYNEVISSIVVRSNSYYGRTIEFHLENKFTLYFVPPINDKIMIGDSIRKDKNTYQYKVYRKGSNGVYVYFAEYDYEHTQ